MHAEASPRSLLVGAGWECSPSGKVENGQVVIEGPANIVNDFEVRLQVRGDFTINAKLEADGESAGLAFWNTLPSQIFASTAWWAGAPKVQVGLRSGAVYLVVSDGTSSKPAYQFTTRGASVTGVVSVSLQKTGDALALIVNGSEATRTTVLGPFVDGPLYLGANVAANARLTIRELTVSGVGQAGEARVEESPLRSTKPLPRQGQALRDFPGAGGRPVGAGGITMQQFRWNEQYQAVTAREFNSVSAGSGTSFDWRRIHPGPDRYSFCDADQIIAFAKTNGMQANVQFLTYGNVVPDWLEKGRFSRSELMGILHRHIETVVGRYQGQVAIWQVGNEVLEYDVRNPGKMRDTVWSRGIGPDYVDMAFRWAHEADPQAVLILNETGNEGLDRKSDAFFELVRSLRTRGVPINGVGMQMHWPAIGGEGGKQAPTPQAVAANMKRLADVGLDVYITEMDVAVQEPATAEKLATQAQVYRDILAVCLAASNCKGFTVMGVYDAQSWLLERPRFEGLTAPLLFDESFRPKAAYRAMIDELGKR